MNSEFERCRRTDVTVHMMFKRGCSLEDIIVVLCKEKEMFLKRALELEAIAPRKIVTPDGQTFVWRCPDDLAPVTKVPAEQPQPQQPT